MAGQSSIAHIDLTPLASGARDAIKIMALNPFAAPLPLHFAQQHRCGDRLSYLALLFNRTPRNLSIDVHASSYSNLVRKRIPENFTAARDHAEIRSVILGGSNLIQC